MAGDTARLAEDTFPKLLLRNAALFGDRPAMREKDLGIWQTWTWSQMLEEVRAFSLGLRALGLQAGGKVAIVGSNRPRLYWTFAAVQSLGAVPIPVYSDAVAEEMAFVLKHAEATMAVVEDQEQVDKLIGLAKRLPKLKHIIYDDDRGLKNYDHTTLHPFDDVQDSGRSLAKADAGVVAAWEKHIHEGKGSDTSVILYTSGTTGQSKGVMLTAERCVGAARDTVAFDRLTETDETLAYLPLAWVGDHYLNYAQGMVAGFCIACPEGPETVAVDLKEIGPTFYFAPPRVFEGLLTQVMIRMEDAGALKRRIFSYFMDVAKQHGEAILDGKPVPFSARLKYALGNMLVYGPLKNVLGFSRIRVAYTAGEAIGPDLFSFFRSLGINLKQLYGQTEAFLYVTAQPDGAVRADTVGLPMANVDIRIADNGEVLFKSPGMFAGYYKDKAKTKETLTKDGYVMTGDAGFFEADGQLKIIDRAKDVGKLKDGTLFAPKYIENKLKFFPDVKEAVAFGDQRDKVCVFLNIDLTSVGNWAERNNIAYASYQELANHPDVLATMEKHVRQVNADLAREPQMAGAQIARFLVLHKELDADDGELTRTQKVRRSFIAERYQPLIDALYSGAKEADITTEVTYEDGRKGKLSARVKISDVERYDVPAMKEAAE
ncbi:MAG: AMP-binding protein [Rhodobiaceae bacterium]|nr:AMP-binding protein [Rhodobiaceae bacterium]